MSIHRLVLRSMVVNALTRHPYDEDDVTMAGDNVFDSRMNPVQFDADKAEVPLIIVYTDEDDGHLQNRSVNAGPYLRHISLRVEIGVGTFQKTEVEGTQAITYGLPETDAGLEATLDLFEQQVMWAMRYLHRPATLALQRYIVRTETIESHPFRDESGNNKLALRRLLFKCVINDDCPPPRRLDDEVVKPVKKVFCGDDFPVDDTLKPLLTSLAQSKSMGPVLAILAGDTGHAQTFPLLRRIAFNVDFVAPAADPYLLAKLKQTQGPDGRIEIKGVWEIKQNAKHV